MYINTAYLCIYMTSRSWHQDQRKHTKVPPAHGSGPLIGISHDSLVNYEKVCQIWILLKQGVLLLYCVAMGNMNGHMDAIYFKLIRVETIYIPKYHVIYFLYLVYGAWMWVGGWLNGPGHLVGIFSLVFFSHLLTPIQVPCVITRNLFLKVHHFLTNKP